VQSLVPQLGLVALLVVLNALFAGSELALVSLREGQLQRLEREGGSGAVLASLARDPNRFLATIQIGITLAGFLASASAAVSLAEPLEEPLGFLGGAARPVSILTVTVVLAYLTLVFGELVPKRIAMQRAERWGLLAAKPLSALSTVTRPAVWLLSRSTDLVVKVLGGDAGAGGDQVTEAELRDLVASQTSFTPQQRQIISGAFEISDRTLREVLRPRPDVVVLDADATPEAGLATLLATGHSRAPVASGRDLDDVIGLIHLRDLIGVDGTVRDHLSEALFMPETAKVLDTLRHMQLTHRQFAVVLGEHGGGEGIVTIEDLIEELVGEIYDETDRDILAVERQADGTLVLPGRFPAHDLPDLGIEVEPGDYATVAGLVLTHLGHIPTGPGDTVTIGVWDATVLAVAGRTITRVRLARNDGQPVARADDRERSGS